jgi:hypothetical protein
MFGSESQVRHARIAQEARVPALIVDLEQVNASHLASA